MKLNTVEREVEISGFEPEEIVHSTIQNSAHMFRLLSDKLYSDKPMAVIRELGANAYDAHIAAGTQDKPFEVHLPNAFEPFFSIRDFGIGLDEEDVKHLYMTYGQSTKSDSNNFVGAFGLGSKSPFAYVDQFTVTSYYNGTKRVFSAFINQKGVPSITKLSDETTDEPNGLEIHMPVEASDFSAFASRAKTIFHRFPVLPVLTGNSSVDLTQVKYVLEGANYKLRDEEVSYYNRNKCCYAIQGVVAYPINLENFGAITLTDIQKRLLGNMPLDITFPMGSLDIAPSREQLSYDKRTQEAIVAALNVLIADVPVQALKTLADAKTLWEAKKLYGEWMVSRDGPSEFMKLVLQDQPLLWNNTPIKSNHYEIFAYDRVEFKRLVDEATVARNAFIAADKAKQVANGANPANLMVTIPDDLQPKTAHDYIGTKELAKWGQFAIFDRYSLDNRSRVSPAYTIHEDIKITKDLEVLLLDDKTQSRGLSNLILHNYKGKNKNVVVIMPTDDAGRDLMLAQFDGCEIKKVSDLQLPPVVVKPNTPPTPKPVVQEGYLIENFQPYGFHDNLVKTQIDLEEGGIYFVMWNRQLLQEGAEFDQAKQGPMTTINGGLLVALENMRRLGMLNDDNGEPLKVYVFNSSKTGALERAIKADKPWVNGHSLVKQKLNTFFKEEKALLKCLIEIEALRESSRSMFDKLGYFRDIKTEKTNSLFSKTVAEYKQILETIFPIWEQSVRISKQYASQRVFVPYYADQKQVDDQNIIEMDLDQLFSRPRSGISDLLKEVEEIYKIKPKIDVSTIRNKIQDKYTARLKAHYPILGDVISGSSYRSEVKRNIKHYIDLCDASPKIAKSFNN